MRQYAFLVVRPLLSSPNPNFSKPRTRTENSDFWSWLTHQLFGRLKSTIPNLQIYLPTKANSEKLGLGIDNPCRIVFLSLWMNKCMEMVNGRHFWNPGVISYAMIPRCCPNSRVFFYNLWLNLGHNVILFLPESELNSWRGKMRFKIVANRQNKENSPYLNSEGSGKYFHEFTPRLRRAEAHWTFCQTIN
jgi:hypothetical protein